MVTKVIASNKVHAETKSNVYSKYSRLVIRVNQRVAALKAQFRVSTPGAGSPTTPSSSPNGNGNDENDEGKALAYQQGLDDLDDGLTDDKVDRSTLLAATDGDNKAESGPPKKLHVSQENLQKAWSASQRSTKEDWMAWMRGLSIELLKVIFIIPKVLFI
jgi:hypothetical protein